MSTQKRTQLISLFDEYIITIINNNNIEIPDDYDNYEVYFKFNDRFCLLYFNGSDFYNWIDTLEGFKEQYGIVKNFFKEYIYEIDRNYLLNLIDPIELK